MHTAMNLTSEQRHTLQQGEAVPMMVDETKCVLIRNDVYEQLKELLDDWDPRLLRRHLATMMAEDWNDPVMNVYDQ